MAVYVVRRLALLVVSLAVAAVVIFLLLRLLPGDPVNALVSVGATKEQIAAARASIGSDLPLPQQFAVWAGQLVTLNLGTSFISGLAVGPQLAQAMVVTVPLALMSFVVATLIAAPVGFIAARYSRSGVGIAFSAFAQLGIAVPVFWIGMLLVWALALRWHVFPAGGFPQDAWGDPGAALHSLILPMITVVIVMSASIARYVRASCLDVLGSDYLRTFRALGAGFGSVMLRHGLRSAAVPVVSILGIELATTFLGVVVIESVFALPGMGSMLITGIAQHDYPTIQGVLVVTTLIVLIVGFLADLTQRLLDPRLRGGSR